MTETTRQTVGIIRPEAVADKLAAIRNHEYPELLAQITAQPRLPELMWFLQYISMQPGGLVKFCADMLEQMPDRFGTSTMRGVEGTEYTLDLKSYIGGEMPSDYCPVREPYQSADDASWRGNLGREPEPVSKAIVAYERQGYERFLKSWTAQQIRDICHRAAAEILPRYLEDLCIEPEKGFERL